MADRVDGEDRSRVKKCLLGAVDRVDSEDRNRVNSGNLDLSAG